MPVTQLVIFVIVIVAVLVALAIAGLVAWAVAALVVWGILEAAASLWPCHERADRDDRLDDLLHRATATAGELVDGDENWPSEEENEELEIRLRALGPDVAIAWRAYIRATKASNEALDGTGLLSAHDEAINIATTRRQDAKRVLLDAVESARWGRR